MSDNKEAASTAEETERELADMKMMARGMRDTISRLRVDLSREKQEHADTDLAFEHANETIRKLEEAQAANVGEAIRLGMELSRETARADSSTNNWGIEFERREQAEKVLREIRKCSDSDRYDDLIDDHFDKWK